MKIKSKIKKKACRFYKELFVVGTFFFVGTAQPEIGWFGYIAFSIIIISIYIIFILQEEYQENLKNMRDLLLYAATLISHNNGLDSTGSQKQEKCILETNDRRKHE